MEAEDTPPASNPGATLLPPNQRAGASPSQMPNQGILPQQVQNQGVLAAAQQCGNHPPALSSAGGMARSPRCLPQQPASHT